MRLYNSVKKRIYAKIPKHSAYRSGLVVQSYKKSFKKKYGNKDPYHGARTKRRGLGRWFAEQWRTQRGKIGYKYKSDVYRPTRRVTKKTPKTFKELGKKRITKARRKKFTRGRVNKF